MRTVSLLATSFGLLLWGAGSSLLAATSGVPQAQPVVPVVQPSLAMPVGLRYATDLATCSQRLSDVRCKEDIAQNDAFLLWAAGACSDPKCSSRISGYHVYEVARGWRPPRSLLQGIAAMPPPLTRINQSTGGTASTSATAPTSSTSASTNAGQSAVNVTQSNPMTHMAATNSAVFLPPRLVLTQTTAGAGGVVAFAELAPPDTVNRCFTVTAFYGQIESPFSDPVCIAANAPVGLIKMTLNPTVVATAYDGAGCPGMTPFSHPSGSVIAGHNQGTRCPYYQGVVAFDLSQLAVSAANVRDAYLTYTYMGQFNADGSVNTGASDYQCDAIYIDWSFQSYGDPHNGLVYADYPSGDIGTGFPLHLEGLWVSQQISKHGGFTFVIMNSGQASRYVHCYSESGNFHLVLDLYAAN